MTNPKMYTSEQCNEAWEKGYLKGYSEFKSTTPSIPPRQGTVPPGEDALEYYYKKGYEEGKKRGLQDAAGMT